MTFARPLLLGAAVVLPWIWWTAARAHAPVGRLRLASRSIAAVCLLAAAAGVAIATGETPMTVVVALDRSASIPLQAQRRDSARIERLQATMRPGDRLGVIAFGADATLVRKPEAGVRPLAESTLVAAGATNIAAAIRLARAALPAGGPRRMLLVSDGRETAGTAERAAMLAAADGVSIDVLPSSLQGAAAAPRITGIVGPADVAAGEPFAVTVQFAGSPGMTGRVSAYRDDEVLASQPVTVGSDGGGSVSFTDRQQAMRSYVYRATIDRGDADEAVPSSGTVITVSGQPRVLYVSASIAVLAAVLGGAGFRIERVVPPAVPRTELELSGYAAVVLDDVAAADVSEASQQALKNYVEQRGGGLLLLGSARTLTAEGYPTGPLAPVIPIDLRPRAGQRAPSLALVVVFDKSGSMADAADGVSKIEVARQAVMRVLDVIPASDALGVIAFDTKPLSVTPLAPGPDRQALAASLQAVAPGGATSIAPAADLAMQWLRGEGGVNASRRELLLLSDGRTSVADATRLRAIARAGGIQVSVIAIGANADRALLEELAASSGGRAYFPGDVRDLPRLVAREAARSSGGGVVEERFAPHGVAHAVLTGIDLARLPSLNGYVVSAAKPAATVVLASHLDDPILCAWRAGLGRVAVFTADLGSTWSAPLRAWTGYDRLWQQTVRWIGGATGERGWQLAVADGADGPRLRLDATSTGGDFAALDDVRAVVRTPDGQSRELALDALAPGIYDAPLPGAAAGVYAVALTASDASATADYRLVRTLYWAADRESRLGVDLPALQRIARAGGGTQLGDSDTPFAAARPRGYADVSRQAMAVGLVLFLLDVAIGRGDVINRWRRRYDRPGETGSRAAA